MKHKMSIVNSQNHKFFKNKNKNRAIYIKLNFKSSTSWELQGLKFE